MNKNSLDKRIKRETFMVIIIFKVVWRVMLFTVITWNFFWLLYTAKSMLGLDIIKGWSLIH